MGSSTLSLRGIALRAWQEEALRSWIAHSRTGVVEAVTGTGKTTLGLAAVVDGLNRGRKILIVVPSTPLLDQWYESVRRSLPKVAVGRRGGGSRTTSMTSKSSSQLCTPQFPTASQFLEVRFS
ncbi:DEAD/DEAH box helicase family protein [Gordonia sp. MMO-8]|uniref:DEAD/DEAH box helicase family protein n=1 Tax=Gordonia sp. MMO-8 TaxID=3127886 RepID=UPI003FA5926B